MTLGDGKLVGERRALASLVLGFFGALYILIGLISPELPGLLICMGVVYLTGFFAVGSNWFWGRWVGMGLLANGAISGLFGAFQEDWNGVILFFALTHLAGWLALRGKTMAEAFEGQPAWRQKYDLDAGGAERIGRTVTRITMAVPLLLGLLFSQFGGAMTGVEVAIAGIALMGALRLRAWAPLLAGACGVVLVAQGAAQLAEGHVMTVHHVSLPATLMAGVLLVAAFAAFARPMLGFLRRAR